MLKELLKILSLEKAKSSDLRNALDQLEASLPALETAVRTAEQRRTGLLLDPAATDRQHDDADTALRLAVRERDRAVAARVELSRKIDIADTAERAAALDAKRNAVEREATAVARSLSRFQTLQREMVAILENLDQAERKVAAINDELTAAGRSDLLAPVETRTIPTPDGEAFEYHSIRNRVVLPEKPGAPGWRDTPPVFEMNFGPGPKAHERTGVWQ